MTDIVSSSSFPRSWSDDNLLLLAKAAVHTLDSLDDDKVSTTTWSYFCPYCKFARGDRLSILKHLKRRHASQLKTYDIEIE